MNSGQLVGITSITAIVLAGGASSIYLNGSELTSEDVEKLVKDIWSDFTTYIKVEDIIGKYGDIGTERELKKLLILIELISADGLNLTNLKIGLSDGKEMVLADYSGKAVSCKGAPLFGNAIWKEIGYNFGLMILKDSDNSIQNKKVANDGDKFFIAINLPDEFHVKSESLMEVYILPQEGMTKTIDVYVPFSCSSDIVFLW